MGSKHLVQLHLPHIIYHHHHHHHNNNNGRKQQQQNRDVPKGCLAVKVGQGSEADQQRFVVPVIYINHPLFMQLLKQAEEEYGFQHQGPITIPCNIDHFQTVRSIIDNEHRHHHQHHHHHHQHHHHQLVGCFRA